MWEKLCSLWCVVYGYNLVLGVPHKDNGEGQHRGRDILFYGSYIACKPLYMGVHVCVFSQ